MRKRFLAGLAAVLLCTPLGVQAVAEENQAAEAPKPTAADLLDKYKAIPLVPYYKNGFVISTADEEFVLKIKGNTHLDSRFYGSNSKSPSTFDIRQARLDLQGDLFGFISFRLQPELADNPYIRNAYVEMNFREWLQLRAGQVKPPFSTDWWTQDNNVNFMERGAGTPVYPFLDRGFWLLGSFFGRSVTYNLSVWTGAGIELDSPRGDIDDHKDFIGKLFVSPFITAKDVPFVRNLHLCIEGTYGRETVATTRFETSAYRAAIYDDRYWTWDTNNPGYGQIQARHRWGAELHYIWGPFSASTEYLVTEYPDIEVFDQRDGTLIIDDYGKIRSWTAWVGFFLTGESKQVSNDGWRQPNPKNNFDPIHLKGLGAWEVLARYTHTKTDDDLFRTADFEGRTYRILNGADDVYEYTFAVNWTWNSVLRWQINYVHLNGNGGGIATGSSTNEAGSNRVNDEDQYAMRMIFRF
ncbi:MAG: porin [bacterium]